MPHQLRRIIAINIRNASDGNPSGRISELDPRGGVLAVGDNGVGKTTFLRLIPLFYGATPMQVLKGSGRASMIKHTLPDPSSAVAYEYERESEAHLRTVVMYAKEGEDVPDFRIITGGFDESYFYDENSLFVTRREFSDRLRARGINVTSPLQLSEYRSVILNERTSSKSAKVLASLAREHSLGPRPLRNLHQISAAMANEKIDFRDLKNIVLERVAEDQASETKRQNVRELKQRKEDVNAWLERRSHMAEILKRKPDADRMKERIGRIKGLHLELCSLHVAVKAALSQAAADRDNLARDRQTQSEAFDARFAELSAAIDAAEAAKSTVHGQWVSLNAIVQAAISRQNHFDRIGASTLADNQAREPSLARQFADKKDELHRLTAEAGSLKTEHEEQVLSIERSAQAQASEIAGRKQVIQDGRVTQALALSAAKDGALLALQEPPRLAEIAIERNRMAVREGEISQTIRNPVATQKTLEEREEASAALEQRQQEKDEASDKVLDCAKAEAAARGDLDGKVRVVEGYTNTLQAVMAQIDTLTAKLTPQPGSLLAFIRESDDPVWTHASKLIAEDLIHRTDLSPVLLDSQEQSALEDGIVVIGNTTLHTAELAAPAWFSMEDVRQQLEDAKARAAQLNELLGTAQTEAERAKERLVQAGIAHERAKALLSLAISAHKTAQADKARADARVADERQAAAAQAKEALARLKADVDALKGEEERIRSGHAGERQAILDAFARQTLALEAETKRQTSALAVELQEVQARKTTALANARADYERKLAGKGLDPERVKAVEGEMDALGAQLTAISTWRHEVEAWRSFCEHELPHIESNQREVAKLHQAALDASARLAQCLDEREALGKRASEILGDFDARLKTLADDEERLTDLRERKLKDFLDFVPVSAYTGRPVREIEEAAALGLRALVDEDTALRGEVLSLRNDFEKREGGPQDWLTLKRQELPDKQTRLEHEYRCLEAQQLCDWFERTESGSYIDQLSVEMTEFFENASVFVSRLDTFDRLVQAFNAELGRALATAKHFERFKDLSVRVTSSVGQQAFLKVLRQMKERCAVVSLTGRSYSRAAMELPSDEDAALVREYREILMGDGGVLVDLGEQVRLECGLYENGRRITITNQEEFRAVSSNGNSALITAMFLMGFVQMIRGATPVRLVWVTDELGRFDAGNVGAFLKTLALNNIDVICASPSVDPALARHFPRLSLFENTGAIFTVEDHDKEAEHELA